MCHKYFKHEFWQYLEEKTKTMFSVKKGPCFHLQSLTYQDGSQNMIKCSTGITFKTSILSQIVMTKIVKKVKGGYPFTMNCIYSHSVYISFSRITFK